MPWLETDVREQRIQFVVEALQPSANISALCRKRGISRKTGYKWIGRYRAGGSLTALAEPSRRPKRSPARTAARITARVVALRRAYGWAGRKLQRLLADADVQLSTATIDRIIRREGLVDPDEAQRPPRSASSGRAPTSCGKWISKGSIRCTGRSGVFR